MVLLYFLKKKKKKKNIQPTYLFFVLLNISLQSSSTFRIVKVLYTFFFRLLFHSFFVYTILVCTFCNTLVLYTFCLYSVARSTRCDQMSVHIMRFFIMPGWTYFWIDSPAMIPCDNTEVSRLDKI